MIYVDLDGVLADFDAWYWASFGLWPYQCKDDKELWGRINTLRAEGHTWFDNLPLMNHAGWLIDWLSGKDCAILTGTGLDIANGQIEKTRWVRKHISWPIPIYFTVSAKEKAKWSKATPKAVLIDDREKAIIPWIQAGGIGILHTDMESTFKGLAVLEANKIL